MPPVLLYSARYKKQPSGVHSVNPSGRGPAVRSQSSPPRSDSRATRHTATGTASPQKLGKSDRSRDGRWDTSVDESPSGIRGKKMTPQPVYMGRAGGARGEDDELNADKRGGAGMGGAAKLHRGLVITDELRKELLNPLAHHRFKLLRGAH